MNGSIFYTTILEKLHHIDSIMLFWLSRCKLNPVIVEVDRMMRPGGMFVVRDESSTISEVETLLKSLHWEITYSKEQEGLLSAKKGTWRPKSVATS
jgi:hypothetical protein